MQESPQLCCLSTCCQISLARINTTAQSGYHARPQICIHIPFSVGIKVNLLQTMAHTIWNTLSASNFTFVAMVQEPEIQEKIK